MSRCDRKSNEGRVSSLCPTHVEVGGLGRDSRSPGSLDSDTVIRHLSRTATKGCIVDGGRIGVWLI